MTIPRKEVAIPVAVVVGVLLVTAVLLAARLSGQPRLEASAVEVVEPENGGGLAAATSTATSSQASLEGPCGDCLTEEDNGKIVSILEASRITLELPANAYKKAALQISPEGVLGEAFGAKPSSASRWAQAFEASGTGTVEIIASSTSTNVPHFRLKVVISPKVAAEPESEQVAYRFFGGLF